MMHSEDLFLITVALYCGATAFYLWSLVGGPGGTSRPASVLAWLGLAAQSAGIALRGVEEHRVPFVNLFESLIVVAWALICIYLAMERRYRITGLGAFACTVAAAAIACGSALPRGVDAALMTAIQNRWSGIHIASSLVSYASFSLAFGAALGYTLQERLLKSKRIAVLRMRLPSLDTVDRFAYGTVAIGFPMLTLGVVTGAMWARTAWGAYWSWDPKETWALITWLVYAAYLHIRIVQGWRGKWANRLLVVGFGCILMTFFGVNYLPYGLHKYNW